MRTEIYARLDDMPPRFYPVTRGRVRSALRHWSRRLRKARVFLRDENGAGGAIGTRCRLVLDTEREGSIVTTGRGADPDAALADALHRARRRVRRWKQRRTTRARPRTARRDFRAAA